MPIQINRRPDHDFDEPLGLLSDCHRRIEHFLDVLIAVHAKAGDEALSASDRNALEGSLQYFSTAAPRHTADEEESLFPRVRRWLSTGTLEPAESAELSERLSRLRSLYQRHIAIEDHELFPAAARVLSEDQIGQIGREMAARRGVRPPVSQR